MRPNCSSGADAPPNACPTACRAQIPLIAISQIPWVKRNPTVGNMSFWVGLFIGFPMLNIGCVAQLRHGHGWQRG